MGRKIVSILGTGEYKECIYCYEDKKYKTRYIQEALIEIFMKDIRYDDEIIIFMTDKARNQNWIERCKIELGLETILKRNKVDNEKIEKIKEIFIDDLSWKDTKIENGQVGLEKILKDRYPNLKIKAVEINGGKTIEEQWDTFDKIFNELSENDEVIFDVTHGYRSIPMQALTILNYAKIIKNIKITGVYYGAFEALDRETNEAPIFDLTMYNQILKWTSATEVFVKYGNSNVIYDLVEEQIREGNREIMPFKKFAKSLKDFTNCIATMRGRNFSKAECKDNKSRMEKSISAAVIGLQKDLNNIKNKQTNSTKLLEKLFNKIENKINEFNEESNFNTGINTIQWCIDNGMIQNAFTALDETIKTYLCNYYGLNDTKEVYRDKIVKFAITTISNNKVNKDESSYRLISEVSEKRFFKDINNKTKDEIEEYEIYKKIVSTIPMKIVEISNSISRFRNDINHFGFTKESSQYSVLEKEIVRLFKEFKETINTEL